MAFRWSSLLGSPWLYLAIAMVGASASWWLTHEVESGWRAQEVLVYEQQKTVALTENIRLRAEFDKRLAAANGAANAAKAAANDESIHRMADLLAAIEAERKRNAPLDRCLRTRLPDAIMRALPDPGGR